MVNIESVRSGADKVFSILLFVMSSVFFVVSFSLPESSALLPRLVAFFTAVLNLPGLVSMFRRPSVSSDEKIAVPVYTSTVILLAYYVALVLLGYVVASLAYIVAVSRLIGLKSWIKISALAIIMVGATYYLFGIFFTVALPDGLLFKNFF